MSNLSMSMPGDKTELEPEPSVLVIDNGSGFTKAGFAGDSTLNAPASRVPSAVFPSIVWVDFVTTILAGVLLGWDDMEELWHRTLYGVLKVSPEEHPVLLTEVPINSKENREKMAEVQTTTA